jgi:hypothetical protein
MAHRAHLRHGRARRDEESMMAAVPAWLKRLLGEGTPGDRRGAGGGYRDEMSGTTRFFRNHPQLLALTRAVASIWPAGSELDVLHVGGSVGCEALSFAIMMKEREPGYSLRVTSTDVDGKALEYGRRSRYSAEWFEPILGEGGMPADTRARWFTVESQDGQPVHAPARQVAESLTFAFLDIASPARAITADIVFCNNVLVHMERPMAERCLQNVLRMLRSPALLVCGGMDLDLRPSIRSAGLRPITDSIREIHEAWAANRHHYRHDRGAYYFELEDLDERRPDWVTRYASIFVKD